MAGDLLLFDMLRVSLTRSVDDTARPGAAGVVALIDANRLPTRCRSLPGRHHPGARFRGPDHRRVAGLRPPGAAGRPAQAAAIARNGEAMLVNGAAYGMPSLIRVTAVRAADGALVIAAVPYSSAADSLSRGGEGAGVRDAGAVRAVHRGDLAGGRVHAAADRPAAAGRRAGHGDRGAGRTCRCPRPGTRCGRWR